MAKNYILPVYLTIVAVVHQTHMIANGAPYDSEDHNAIIIIPFKSSDEQITKIESFKIDGETAVKQLSSRVSAEKILRILSNVPEFSILVEGLDTITLGDVYKTAFPNGILNSISENYLRAPTIANNKAVITKPYTTEGVEAIKSTEIVAGNEVEDTGAASETGIQYDEVNEDNEEDSQFSKEDLKEEPITDDYVYDQPVEDRFFEDREYATRQNDEMNHDDTRGSKNMNYTLSESVIEAGHKEKTKYGASFRNWITKFLAG